MSMSDEGCFTFTIHHFIGSMSSINEYLMIECEKACQKAVATVNIKPSIFNLQYLNYFCMDFHATKKSRSAVK